MKIHMLIFYSILFIAHTSHSMEIVKKDDKSHEFFFNNFENNFTCMQEWNYFKIPTKYQHILSPNQVNFLEKLFTTQPLKITCLSCRQPQPINLLYILQSKQTYKQFLTLPREIRKCLINGNMRIGIEKCSGGSCFVFGELPYNYIKLKQMIPEDKNYKRQFTKIELKHQKGDTYYFSPLL